MDKSFMDALKGRAFPFELPGHFIAGSFHQCTRGTFVKEIINPSTGKAIATIRLDKTLIQTALEEGKKAEALLKKMSLKDRFGFVRKFRQAFVDYQPEIITAMQVEGGKPEWEAVQEFDSSLRFLDYLLGEEDHLFEEVSGALKTNQVGVEISLEPVGTILAHIPFSTPCTSFSKFFAVAMVSGCPLVCMSSAHASLLALTMAHIVQELDMPKGLLSILCGNFELFRLGCQDKSVKGVIYRGSREHCMTIRQEGHEFLGRPSILQSGGKNAALIHPSAKIEDAAKIVLHGLVKSAGQLCTSTSRAFVHASQLAEFADVMVELVRNLSIGATDKVGSNPTMGPLYSRKSVEKFLRFQTMAKRESKKTIVWGKTVDVEPSGGFFVSPGLHIMDGLRYDSAYQRNVLLFPDLAIYEYDRLEEAVNGVNSTDAPLVTCIVTQDMDAFSSYNFVPPNLMINLPTVEQESQLPVAGRSWCGTIRHNGIGMVENLTYPVAKVCATDPNTALKNWPLSGKS